MTLNNNTFTSNSGYGAYISATTATLGNNTFSNNGGGAYISGTTVTSRGDIFKLNGSVSGSGAYIAVIAANRAKVTYCTFEGNKTSGGYGGDIGVRYSGSNPVIQITQCNLLDTEEYEIYNGNGFGTPDVDATNNWWGTTDEATIKSRIYDFFDDTTRGIVNYKPFLTAPVGEPTTGTITGTITDSTTGNGIAGATVSTATGGYSTTTDSSGRYTLSNVTPGTYTVTASKSGYQSNSQGNVKVVAGETTTVNLALTPSTPAAPVANFTASPTSGTAPLAVQFTDQSTGNITSWSWSFGDGGTSTQQNPSHTYNSAGFYTVSLTMTGPGGSDTETKASYIQVTKSTPSATVTISPATAEIKVGE